MKRNSVIQQGPQICNGIRLILKMRTIWFFKIKNWNLGVESCSPSHRDTEKAYGGEHGSHEQKGLWPGGWRGNRVDSVQQGVLKACKKQRRFAIAFLFFGSRSSTSVGWKNQAPWFERCVRVSMGWEGMVRLHSACSFVFDWLCLAS